MENDVLNSIQRDIDEICQFGYYSVAEAYKTLIASKEEINRLKDENSKLVKNVAEWVAIAVERVHEINRLKDENKELEKCVKEAIELPKGVEPHRYSDLKLLTKNK